MSKVFNVSGACTPKLHYMVDLASKLEKIKEMVDKGQYFTINRARQYGKTTILRALEDYLKEDYLVLSIDFQMLSSADFASEQSFVEAFTREIFENIENRNVIPKEIREQLFVFADGITGNKKMSMLFRVISRWCGQSDRPIVLMIDEVDSATDNQVFLDFLAQLRGYYLRRDMRHTFQSVILAGVYDIKNLKLRMRPEEKHKYNSPWNIAVDFNVDISFSRQDIASMLMKYESDHKTGMDIENLSRELYDYSSGYPYLVSKICQLMDERVIWMKDEYNQCYSWSNTGFQEAVKILLKEPNTLFDDMIKKLTDYPELKDMLKQMLFGGRRYSYESNNFLIHMGTMFGFLKNEEGSVVVSNRIYEMKLYNWLISEEETGNELYKVGVMEKQEFVKAGILNMELVLQKFMEHFTEVYTDNDQKFLEENGRRLFLLYLKPIINGTGNYYIESRTRDMKRTDVIVDYLGKQYIIELKIWHGQEYNARGEKQLFEYLDCYHKNKGYMLSFNFNKHKVTGMKTIEYQGKTIIEVVV